MRVSKWLRDGMRKEWVRALKSGEYEKVKGVLCKVEKGEGRRCAYCVMGLACEIAYQNGVVSGKELETEWGSENVWGYDNELAVGTIPERVRKAFGFRSAFGKFEGGVLVRGKWSLTGLNDDRDLDLSFEELGELVEENWNLIFED